MKKILVNEMCFELHEDHAELCFACKGMEKAVIPDEVEGLPVTVLQKEVFMKHVELREVIFPRTLVHIGPACFCRCFGAFQNTDMMRIVLPETVTTLPYRCFRTAANLREVVAPGVTEVADKCFEGCRSLEKVVTKPLDKVGAGSFNGCTSLREIRLSPECRRIDSQAFYGCSSLHHVEAEGVREVFWRAFAECSSLDEMPHMPRLERVGNYAFRDCSGLTRLTFPATLVEIEQGAFSGCDGLTSIEFQGNTTGVIHENAFETAIQTKFLTDPDMFYSDDEYDDGYEEDVE